MTIPQEIYDMIEFLERIKRGPMISGWWHFDDLDEEDGSILIEYWWKDYYKLHEFYKTDAYFSYLTKDQLLAKLAEFFDKIEGIKDIDVYSPHELVKIGER